MVRQRDHLKRARFVKGSDPRRYAQGRMMPKPGEKPKRAVRLSKTDFDDVISLDSGTNVFTAGAHEKLTPMSMVLRPAQPASQAIDRYQQSTSCEPPRCVNRLMNLVSVENLFNKSFKEHSKYHTRCDGNLVFDMSKEITWGTGVRESLKCTKCSYRGERMKLYDTIPDKCKKGAKASTTNVQVQAALFNTGVGHTDLRHVFVGLNTSQPSLGGMQKQRNSVANQVEKSCDKSFEKTRRHINDVKESLGFSREHPIPVEMDTRYNNSLSCGIGRTPGQPATQAVATACENFTKKKKVVAVHTVNKLCSKALHSTRKPRECPNHPGKCTATLSQTAVIGDEKQYATEITKQITKSTDPLNINFVTTDGDSKMFNGVQAATEGEIINLRDTRHLSERLRKRIEGSGFSDEMLPGSTKRLRTKCLKRFALDVQKRVHTEFNSAYEAANGDMDSLIRTASFICDAIVSCYNGDHSVCYNHSFACRRGHPWTFPFMSDDQINVFIAGKDEQLLRECLNMRLGRDGILKQRLNTSTQKTEAVNRAYQRTNPKAVLNTRNFPVQVKTAAACLNDGVASTTAMHFEEVGAPLTPGSPAVQALITATERKKYHATRQRSKRYKLRRVQLAVEKYKNYDISAENDTYMSGMAEAECQQTLPQTRSKGDNKVDHCYNRLV